MHVLHFLLWTNTFYKCTALDKNGEHFLMQSIESSVILLERTVKQRAEKAQGDTETLTCHLILPDCTSKYF